MTTDADVLGSLQALFQELLDDETITLLPETTAQDVEDWDSVSHLELMVAIEKEFDIRFSTGEIAGFDNVGALVSGIQRHRGQERDADA